ncbi:MAG: exonuclease SbcCD subunit D [Candidatus Kapabacteria bacterium]|nr:exonuclease SbcCD subunit D [Candidatus Kapabacteria bacterium]MDW8011839.1 exonuclease SbcCD subunit D [Bacteroidota bacterium]
MIRLLHTADWHLGKRLRQFNRLEEQCRALESLVLHADEQKVHAILIAGDVYDSANPPAEAQTLCFKVLHELARGGERPVIVIAGNHDSPERLESAACWGYPLGVLLLGSLDSTLPQAGTHLGKAVVSYSANGILELQHPRWPFDVRFLLTPYVSPYRLQQIVDTQLPAWLRTQWEERLQSRAHVPMPTVLVAHLYCSADGIVLQEDEEERPISFGNEAFSPDDFPSMVHYVALGHLHQFQIIRQSSPTIAYSGSLLQYSFSDTNPNKVALLVELNPNGVQINPLPLSGGYPLYRLICQNSQEALQRLQNLPSEAYVELLLYSDAPLSPEELQQLRGSHRHLFITPVKLQQELSEFSSPEALLDDIETLFTTFFRYKERQDPDAAMVELFREVLQRHRALQHDT